MRETNALVEKPGAWIDLALTLPIFLAYHAGVVFLKIQNATDVVTPELVALSEGNRGVYLLITAAIGTVFAGIFAWLGRGQAFRTSKFLQVIAEGALYAVLMRLAGSYAVSKLFAASIAALPGPAAAGSALADNGRLAGAITSMGAGFYEELTFRVVLFGLGGKLLVSLFARQEFQAVRAGGPAFAAGRGHSLRVDARGRGDFQRRALHRGARRQVSLDLIHLPHGDRRGAHAHLPHARLFHRSVGPRALRHLGARLLIAGQREGTGEGDQHADGRRHVR
ncbi:MAG TPA: hypothetical protein VNO21_03975 [Polyangiaceae bacterium]|nr:hypothetical protein [Polyangiaceae bacterium]